MTRLDSSTAIVTGGSSGIGRATAQLLVDRGARVIITGRGAEALDQAALELGPLATAVTGDVSSLEDVDALAERARTDLGGVDLLFVNAGVTLFSPVDTATEDDFDRVFATNVKGPYFTVQRLAPLVRDGGSIVLTTSVAGVKGLAGSSIYAASKAAVRSLTRSFARELQPRGIRVNAVSPGPIDTGILERSSSPEAAAAAREQMTATNPMHRFGTPDEVARAVLFLAFDATYSTGSELAVDGGTSQL